MTELAIGTYGAKVQSWRRANPRDLLKRVIEENQGHDRTALLKAFREEVMAEDGEDYLDSIIEYWFANNYHSLTVQPKPPTSASPTATKRRTEAVKSKITERIHKEAQMILLDMMLPNGKALRDCTGKECLRLSGKIGAWLKAVAAQVKPNQKVGAALSEKDVREMYGR